jgi:hypothetical protein
MKKILVITVLLSSFFAQGQDESYSWQDGICFYEGEINAELTNREQLDNIVGLLMNPSSYNQPVFRIQLKDSTHIRPEKVKRELENAIKELENAQFPKANMWDSIRKIRVTQLKRELELKMLGIEAMRNPAVLKTDKKTAKSCKKIITVLCSDPATILKEYKKIYGEEAYNRIKNSGYSEKVMAEMASIDFLRYEWWNTASKTIGEINYMSKINQEMKKLIQNWKVECH